MHAVTATIIDTNRFSVDSEATTFHVHKEVFICTTEDALVFLDLRRDRYFGLPIDKARTLAHLVADWPISTSSHNASDQDASSLAHRLEEAELLTRDPAMAQVSQTIPSSDSPGDLWMLDEPASLPPIHLGHFLTFARTCAKTKWRLRGQSLATTISHIRNKKVDADAADVDLETVAKFVSIFRRLRVFAFAANGHCLYHAIALVEFLAHYSISATLVVGVHTHPWAAHSWVQYGTALLDSKLEHVHAYTVIYRS